MFSISFTRANTKFCLNLHYNTDNNFFINGNRIFKFKADYKMLTFQLSFTLEVYLMNFVILSLKKYF